MCVFFTFLNSRRSFSALFKLQTPVIMIVLLPIVFGWCRAIFSLGEGGEENVCLYLNSLSFCHKCFICSNFVISYFRSMQGNMMKHLIYLSECRKQG